ncbi:unnamed protein product, partial [Soboliphyme baturini]|uniref:Sister chromatid cohesion protein DCC1 n=1 Tax=Soboliphyme baturini TaxID=241478 RepID=A0A183J6P5_9BILA
MDELVDLVPANMQCVEQTIKDMPVCIMNGFVRLLHFDYLSKVTSEITGAMEEFGFDWRSFNATTFRTNFLDMIPPEVLDKWFSLFAHLSEDGNTTTLDERKVCRLYARMLLKPFHMQEFLVAWQQSVPPNMNTSLEMLDGLAILHHDPPPCVQYFPEEELSPSGLERFQRLFLEKEKWSMEEIEPYARKMGDEMEMTTNGNEQSNSAVPETRNVETRSDMVQKILPEEEEVFGYVAAYAPLNEVITPMLKPFLPDFVPM